MILFILCYHFLNWSLKIRGFFCVSQIWTSTKNRLEHRRQAVGSSHDPSSTKLPWLPEMMIFRRKAAMVVGETHHF